MIQQWNRLVRFIAVEDGQEHFGEPVDRHVDGEPGFCHRFQTADTEHMITVGKALADPSAPQVVVFRGASALDPRLTPTDLILTIKSLLPPLSKAEIGTIRCIGLNYRSHAAEMNFDLPTHASVFFKPSTCLRSPDAALVIPYQATDQQADYEAELAVVIGRDCRNVDKDHALDYVLGYMCSNDVTARKWQFAGGNTQWGYGKDFDGFAPMGPCLVSTRQIPDPKVIELKTVLNGTVMQEGKVDDMIFSVPEIVSYLSQGTTLEAGTVIMTGTPHGIGVSRDPPVFLQQGDALRITMSHGLGSLVNPVVYEEQPRGENMD